MNEQNQLDLATYMNGSISRIMTKALKNVLSNPREAKFAFKMRQLFAKSEKRRKTLKEQEGYDVPPFLISSIAGGEPMMHKDIQRRVTPTCHSLCYFAAGSHLQRTGETMAPSFFSSANALSTSLRSAPSALVTSPAETGLPASRMACNTCSFIALFD
jgi:hypothetical protein